MYEWLLVLIMATSDGNFGAIYRGFTTESDCRDVLKEVVISAPGLRLDDGSKPEVFTADCKHLDKVPDRS